MKSSLIAAALAATLSSVEANNIHHMPALLADYKDSDAYYYIQGLRGFWLGYETGFYKNSKSGATSQCLNDNTVKDIVDIVEVVESFDTSKLFGIFNEAMSVYNNFQECSVQQSINDIVTFCNTHPQNCNGSALIDNLTQNMFVLMGQATQLSTVMNGFPAETAEELYTQTETLGNTLGTVVRVVSGFAPSTPTK